MNIDAYIPLYGKDFFGAVDGYDDTVIVAYLRALWQYWQHFKCSGLPNDDDYLRRLCRCEMVYWARVRDIVFGQLFTLNGDGKWHQKRADIIYQEALEAYNKRVNQTEAARKAAAAKKQEAATGNVTKPVTGTVTQRNQNQNQINNQTNNEEPKPEPKPKPKQLNDERLMGSPDASSQLPPIRSSSNRSEKELMAELKELLGDDEMARAGGHWRKNWVRKHPGLLQRALEDMRLQIKERGPDFAENRGGWLTDLLKRWLT